MVDDGRKTWVRRTLDRWRLFADTGVGRRSIRAVRVLFLLAVLLVLAWQLRDIGWSAFFSNLPTQPLFYVLFLVLYFFHVVAEMLVYRVRWPFRIRHAFPGFVRKRVLNRDVLGYSGEVYLIVWARSNIDVPARQVAEDVRDNNILSSVASTIVAVVLLVIFLSLGRLSVSALIGEHWILYLVLGVGVPLVLSLLWLRFRHLVFGMPARSAGIAFALHVGRFVIGRVIQILQWIVVMPAVPLSVWFTYAAASILLSRIPFLPNQSLVFAGVGIEMSSLMDVPVAPVAGMLLVSGILERLLNAAFFAFFSAREARRIRSAA